MLDLEVSCCRVGWVGIVRYDAFGDYSLRLRYVWLTALELGLGMRANRWP